MAENGILDYQGMNQAIYRGATSNIIVDTQSMSIEIGAGNSSHTSNLHIECDHDANVASIQLNSNVVTEFSRSKKLIKYPRVALTSAAETGSGYEGYIVTRSSQFSSYNAWEAFDENNPVGGNTGAGHGWASTIPGTYSVSTGAETGTVQHHSGSVQGEWIQIQLPESIYLHDFVIESRSETTYGADGYDNGYPKSVVLYGSINGSSWVNIRQFTTGLKTFSEAHTENINETTRTYKYFALVVNSTQVVNNTTQVSHTAIGQIRLFGTPETDPEAHGVDVTIKSIPNVPNTDWLEVYYDGQDYSTMPVTVTDKSGNNRTGTPTGGVGFDTEYKAFTFNKTDNQYLSTSTPMSGNYVHSVSLWFKPNSLTAGSGDALFYVGATSGSSNYKCELFMESDRINYTFGGNQFQTYPTIVNGKWYHITVTYNGNGGQNGREIYLNNVKLEAAHSGSAGNLNLTSNNLDIGRYTPDGSATTSAFDGSIANFRLFNRVLTTDEIYQLYAYQKEYFGHGDLGMTLKAGRLGIGTSEPKAALDVKGDIHGGCPVYFQALYDANLQAQRYDVAPYGTVIPWNTVSEQKGNCFDTSNGLFKAPIDGLYSFGYSVRKRGGTYDDFWTYVQKNGSPLNGTNNSPGRVYVDGGTGVGATSVFASQRFILYLSAGDTVGIIIATVHGLNAQISNSYNSFHGYYIGGGNSSVGNYSY